MSFLTIEGLTASYGPSQALFGVDLDMREAEVVALMGRNGMGKTTTVKAICRMVDAQGILRFDGQDLLNLPSHKVARMGVGLVPEV
ncbi:MAG: ATP-binding cassette domain-containing protein, partial [Pseudomonadota bacterium]